MSWQAYVDTTLVGGGHVDKGAIISAAGDSVWAASPDFQLSTQEMKTIADVLSANEAVKDKCFAEGLYIAGRRHVMAKVEERSIYARGTKADGDANNERTGVAIAKTKQAIVLGHHDHEHVAGNATSSVEALADYLIQAGY